MTSIDRLDADRQLTLILSKLLNTRDPDAVQAAMLGRARQAHHGIENVEVRSLARRRGGARLPGLLNQMHGWQVVLYSLAGTVLLVGGVGVLSVMLISFADRRYEIGLRKAIGADDHQILVQFLLEALVLAALGATVGTLAGSALCHAFGQVPIRAGGQPVRPRLGLGHRTAAGVHFWALSGDPRREAESDGSDAVTRRARGRIASESCARVD